MRRIVCPLPASLAAAAVVASVVAAAPVWAQTASPAPVAGLTPESGLLSPEDLALRRKLQAFVHCLNQVGTSMHTLVEGYHHAYAVLNRNPKAEFSKMDYMFTQQYTGMVFKPGAGTECADRLTAAAAAPPADAELDGLAVRYAAGLRQLDTLAPKIETYYNQQNYRDDQMVAGRAMNATYEPVLKELAADTHIMFEDVHKRIDTIDEHRVDAIAQHDGKRLRWEANAYILQARVTMRTLDGLIAAKTLSKELITAAVTPLEVRYASTTAYAAAHPEESNDDMTLWDRSHQEAEDFVTDMKNIRRNAADGAAGERLVADIDESRTDYNRLIGAANVSKR